MRVHRAGSSLAFGLLTLAGCASGGAPAATARPDVRWEPVILWEGDAGFETVKSGRPDASDPNLQVVGVDQAGHVVLAGYDGVTPRSRVIYDHGAELTGLAIDDVDPAVPGQEVYVGGYESGDGREGKGGAVMQVVVGPSGATTRKVFVPGNYVHSIAVAPPAAPGAPRRLVVSTYAGEVFVVTPAAGDGLWPSQVVYRDPPIGNLVPKDPRPRIKDVAMLADPSGRPAYELIAVSAGGSAVYADLDRPGITRDLINEEGGFARITAVPDGSAYACAYWGGVFHFVRDGAGGFRADVLTRDGKDSGLRGIVLGRFPLPADAGGGVAEMAIFGYHALVRMLVPRNGTYDMVTVFKDVERGHSLVAADMVPGNDADELVVTGYSKRLTLLVPRP